MKTLLLIQIKGKLKSFGCMIEAGKLIFDFKNDVTMITDGEENEIKKQNSIEPQVRSVFLQMIEKKANKKIDVLIMNFNFPDKSLKFETYYNNGTQDEQTL